ncbi:hypothetical protein Lepto7375DRAFT_0053 [Leptolyngbya sp. PCC 7375]|nr:hypothetical protein Lepto7375DRAFT_0053 [Leptolyngbya sp. PCC 7375]
MFFTPSSPLLGRTEPPPRLPIRAVLSLALAAGTFVGGFWLRHKVDPLIEALERTSPVVSRIQRFFPN